MKYSNQDIINYYKNLDGYSEKIPEIIQFDKYELDVINSLFKNIYFGYNIRKEQNTAIIRLSLNYIDDPEDTKQFIKEEFNDINEELLNNFININLKWTLIDINTEINFKYFWTEEYDLTNKQKLVKENRYKIFETSFFVSLSRVGFNMEKTKAMVQLGRTFGPLSGNGEYIIMEKKDNDWEIIKSIESWIS